MKYPEIQIRSVLITGCSSGIGAATATVLRNAGWTVYPTARKDEDLQSLRDQGFDPIRLDLADSESVESAASEVLEKSGGTVSALVNNAGFAQMGALEDISRDALRAQFEINVFGLHQLTNLLIPVFRKQKCGRIVNVSSIYGVITAPMVGSYCASKYAVEAMSDALRVELRDSGIAVSLIEPGPIVSAFRRNAAANAGGTLNNTDSRFGDIYEKETTRRLKQVKKPDMFTRPPEAVAARIRHALESRRPRIRYLVTIPAYLGAFASRFLPARLIDHALAGKLPK